MILDILKNYSFQEQERIFNLIERWYLKEYKSLPSFIQEDLYKKYPDAPYRTDNDDDFFNDPWFDDIISDEEYNEAQYYINLSNELKSNFYSKGRKEYKYEIYLYYSEDYLKRAYKFLNNDISYFIVRTFENYYGVIYFKKKEDEIRFKINTHISLTYSDLEYAINDLNWHRFNFSKIKKLDKEKVTKWLEKNKINDLYICFTKGDFYFRNIIDYMAFKLKWL